MEEPDIKFSVMVSLFNWMQRSKSSAKKRSKFRKFLDAFCRKPGDYFSTIRLILPALDRERGSYGLKEHALATCIIDALAMSRDSPDAQRLLNWRKGGPKTGSSAGNFSLVAFEVLQRRQGMSSGELLVKELNELLDRLASSENRAEKTSVLSDLIMKTNAQEMKWIIMIILKDLKLGTSEKAIFHEFHPDAEDLFNVTCDLKLVCEKLRDRNQRHKRQDIEVGKPVRPQLALRVNNANTAWKKLHGKEVVAECKFDGDRIQIHKNNSDIHFFSRNFIDHPEYGHAMSDIITQNILVDRCILDGEMLVWNTSTNRFAEFGSNQEIAKAAKEGLDSDRQKFTSRDDDPFLKAVLELVIQFEKWQYFVIHQTLRERHNLLCKYVKHIKGRLEILVPNGSLSTIMPSGEPCWSLIARSAEDVEKFFKETIENRDEGIVLKDLNSKWEPSDRSGKWLKLKPEYVRAGSDLDVLVIGGYYGSGRHGGEVAQFLVGLAERPEPNTYPRRFVSFCRVGTGLSDEELDAVVTKLKPHFRKYEYPKKATPSFYQVTNNSKERPDVWVESPEKSIILSITSDIRTIKSEVFAAPYSLRFPRIDRVKFDKPWYECLDVQTFVDLVHSSNGTTWRGADFGDVQDHKPKRLKSTRTGEKKNVSFVPSHLIQTDISNVKGETLIFSKMVFYFANVPSSHSLDLLHKMVVENGGSFSMNLNKSVTHCIAAESRGIKFHAAKLSGDVIHYSWLLECCLQRKLLPLQPKYFLYLSEPSKEKLREEIDEFSDSYYLDVEIEDLKQVFSSFGQSEDPKTIDYYKKKYCPKDKWIQFHGCYIYFCLPPETFLNKSEWKILLEFALRRMKVKVSCGGGSVGASLSHATHLVVMALPGLDINLDMVLSSLSVKERHLLLSNRLHIVTSKWLEDSLMADQKLPEDSYSLKSNNLKELVSGESGNQELNLDSISCSNDPEVQCVSLSDKEVRKRKGQAMTNTSRLVTLPKKEDKTKRGTSSRNHLQKRTGGIKQMRRVRPRVGNKPVKINENDLDGSGSENGEDNESCKTYCKLSPEIQDSKEIDNFVSSQPEKTSRQDAGDKSCPGERSSEIHEVVESGSGNGARVECAIDPLQAMLRDMIPVLGSSEVKSMDRVLGDEKSPVQGEKTSSAVLDSENKIPTPPPDPNSMPEKRKTVSFRDLGDERPPMQGEKGTSAVPHSENEIPRPDPSSVPEKRKKVSYKDLAAELLKEW